jgi:integrase
VKNLILDLQTKGSSPATVENIRAIISGIFSYACEEELIQINPASRLSRFIKKRDKRKNGKFLTQEQISIFLKTVHQLFPNYYALFVCAFSTGMRLGEILALAWEDIDFDKKTIKVERAYSNGNIDTTKNGKVHFVDMSENLHDILLKHQEKIQSRERGILPELNLTQETGSINTIHLVFPNRNGKPIDGANLKNRVFYKVIEAAGLSHFRFHDIRHTFASMLLHQGESLHYVKEQMGHASIQTTVDIYGHICPSSNRNVVNKSGIGLMNKSLS